MKDYVFPGGTAVVTGAASGIGAALVRGLAARGSDVALLDRDADGLDAVAQQLRAQHPGVRVRTYVVDLVDPAEVETTATTLLTEEPRVTLLVNNASVALVGRFDQSALSEFWEVMDINFRATVQLTHLLLPALKASRGSHLANVSSAFGLLSPPRQSAYGASKFAVRGFTESLSAELRPDGVGVTCIHPGGTRTNLPDHTRAGAGVPEPEARAQLTAFRRILTMRPEHVAEKALTAIEHRRPRVVVGFTGKVPDLVARVLPGTYTRGMAVSEAVLQAGFSRWVRRSPAA